MDIFKLNQEIYFKKSCLVIKISVLESVYYQTKTRTKTKPEKKIVHSALPLNSMISASFIKLIKVRKTTYDN